MTQPPLTIQLFGPLHVLVHGEPLPRLRTRSIEWLLALLTLRSGRAVSREWLSGTLWPDSEPSQALKNLRNDLSFLRAALGTEAARIQSPTHGTITLDLDGVDVDVLRFDSGIDRGDEDSLREVVELHVGPLLEGCYEEWAHAERQLREEQCLAALERLALLAENRGDWREGILRLRRAESMEPLRDSIVRRLMKASAEEGDTSSAVEAYRAFRLRLRDQLGTEPEGETTSLYNEIRTAARQNLSLQTNRHSLVQNASIPERSNTCPLPHPMTSLIGREEAVRNVCERMRESRLVTLIGGGGVGKTRLAIEAASRMEASYSRAAWVDLAPISEAALVVPTLAEAVGIRQEGIPDVEPLLDLVAANLSAEPHLVVLDNCEHLLDTVATLVHSLLSRCADLRVLATSRQRLGLTGEIAWRVPSLTVANPEKLPADLNDAVELALASPAAQLFFERGAAVNSGFRMTRLADVETVCRICRRLDGIPLAIELAAARVRSLTVGDILQRLDQRFSLLVGGPSAVLTRHQTLRSLIDWSFDLLSEAEKALLCRCSLFIGGWTIEAAERVCAGEPVSELDVLDLLTSLADKSLVSAETAGESARFRILETVRQYARDRLIAAGEESVWRRRHFDFFLSVVVKAQPHLLDGAEQKKWLELLEPEHDNLRAALEWGMRAEGTIDETLQMGGALWRFWIMRGHAVEGRARLMRLLATAPAIASPFRASVLTGAGNLAWTLGDFPGASALHEEALAAFRQLGNQSGIAAALNNLGIVASVQCDYSAAKAYHEESLAMRRKSRDRRGIAYSLANLGLAIYGLRDYATARTLQEESLAIRRDLGDRRGIAISLANLAMVSLAQGDPGSAHAYDEESLQIRWELGDMTGTALSLEGLAPASAALGDPIRAARLWGTAERLREEIHSPLTPKDLISYEAQVAATRAELGDDQAFDAAWAEGRSMNLDQAIELALSQ